MTITLRITPHSLLPASPPGTWPTDSLVGFMPVTVAPCCPQNDPVQPPWGLCSLCLPGMLYSSDPTAIPTMAHSLTFLKNNVIRLYFWLHQVFTVACRLLSSHGAWASHFGGFSYFGALALELRLLQWRRLGSVVAVPGL